MKKTSPSYITKLAPNEIFVFGSNLAGRNGKGAAKLAQDKFGAKYGIGIGFSGQSYAIPTKDGTNGQSLSDPRATLPLEEIKEYVSDFLYDAEGCPELIFLVTEIGCGLAGYDVSDIAPMFETAQENVWLPNRFVIFLEKDKGTGEKI